MQDLNVIFKKNDVIEEKLDDQIFIIPIKDGLADMNNICAISKVSCFIWQEITGDKSIKNIIDSVIMKYDVDTEVAKNDVLEFLLLLKKEKLIR